MHAIETIKEISPSVHSILYAQPILHQLARNIREFALLQLRLPEYRVRITEAMLDPSILLHMIQVDETTRIRISVCRSQDTSASERQCLFFCQIVVILSIQDTVSKCLSRSNTEEVAGQTGPIGIDVVKSGPLFFCDAGAHGAHGESHAFVGIDEVGEDLGSGGNGDSALVTEFVEAALHA
jgi:hypothetical protein